MKENLTKSSEAGWDRIKKIPEEERLKKYGHPLSRREKIIRYPAELKEILETEYYPLRKIDIKRIIYLAESAGMEKINILDLGCGKGTLCRLLAKELEIEKIEGQVIGMDNNIDQLLATKKATASQKNLVFVAANAEEADAVLKNIGLGVISWQPPLMSWAKSIDLNKVEKLKIPFILSVSDLALKLSRPFKGEDNYLKIGEWQGPASINFLPEFGAGEDEGLNLFEIFLRKEFLRLKKTIEKKMDALDNNYFEGKIGEYNWEDELDAIFPEKCKVNFESENFWRE